MKKVLIFLGAILFIIVFGYYYCIFLVTPKTLMAQEEQIDLGNVEAEDLIIKGIKLYSAIQDYDKLSPDRFDIKKDQRGQLYYYYYPSFTLICDDGGEAGAIIMAIVVTSPIIKTRRGIGIGSSEKEVFKHYGDIEKDKNLITYYLTDLSEGISFKVIKGKVAEIAVFTANNPFDFE